MRRRNVSILRKLAPSFGRELALAALEEANR